MLDGLGLSDIVVAAIAKGPDRNAGRERIYIRGREPLILEPRDPVLYCLQTLRDEAHRFAIGAHRARRKKTIGGLAARRSCRNWADPEARFASAFRLRQAVSRAGIADLEAVGGISAAMAKAIYVLYERG